MNWAGGFVFLVLVFFVTSQTAGASQLNADGNYTETGNATDGGSVPAVFTSVSQIIAREGSCTLIDCNVTGEPFPSVQWFNSHGHRVDTSGEIDFFFIHYKPGFLLSLSYYKMITLKQPTEVSGS